MSTSPDVVKARRLIIRSGLKALERMERTAIERGVSAGALRRIRDAFVALDLEQAELAATLDLAAHALKSNDRDGVEIGGNWIPRDVIVDEVEETARLRKRRGGAR